MTFAMTVVRDVHAVRIYQASVRFVIKATSFRMEPKTVNLKKRN